VLELLVYQAFHEPVLALQPGDLGVPILYALARLGAIRHGGIESVGHHPMGSETISADAVR
jgi:hypothetical protein